MSAGDTPVLDELGRPLPALDDVNIAFWTAGAAGELRFQRCQNCGTWLHPYGPICFRCLSRNLAFEAVSGQGTVFSFTINRHPWRPGLAVPYVIALVELPEQPSLRLLTNIVNCPPEDVTIGMVVRVMFEHLGEHSVPLFEPDLGGDAAASPGPAIQSQGAR